MQEPAGPENAVLMGSRAIQEIYMLSVGSIIELGSIALHSRYVGGQIKSKAAVLPG